MRIIISLHKNVLQKMLQPRRHHEAFTNESALLVEMILVFPPLPLTTDLTKQHIYRSSSVVMNFIICLTIMDDL